MIALYLDNNGNVQSKEFANEVDANNFLNEKLAEGLTGGEQICSNNNAYEVVSIGEINSKESFPSKSEARNRIKKLKRTAENRFGEDAEINESEDGFEIISQGMYQSVYLRKIPSSQKEYYDTLFDDLDSNFSSFICNADINAFREQLEETRKEVKLAALRIG